MESIAFVILHYMSIEITTKAIDSILWNIDYSNYRIIVVDNGSPNGTGKQLLDIYKGNAKVIILCEKENRGFSAGSNIGFYYAKAQYNAKFIIVMNNDVLIQQKNFVQKIQEFYFRNPYYILGPDILGLDGIHQSPQRNHIITQKEVEIWFYKRYLFSVYLHIHRCLHLPSSFFIYRLYKNKQKKMKMSYAYNKEQENVELQGACLIFSPDYIKYNDFAFEELTFMYGEEMLLTLRCKKNGWKMIYSPEIQVIHAEHYTVSKINKNEIENDIFYSDSHVKAIKQIKKKMREIG